MKFVMYPLKSPLPFSRLPGLSVLTLFLLNLSACDGDSGGGGYLHRLRAGSFTRTKTMTLPK
ncbi:hypothetical protein [Rhodocaloribacter sp.]